MDIRYQLGTIERKDTHDIELEYNIRQSLLYRSRLLYSRLYNANTLRIAYPVMQEYIAILDQMFDDEIVESTKATTGSLDHIIYDGVTHYGINEFTINNL